MSYLEIQFDIGFTVAFIIYWLSCIRDELKRIADALEDARKAGNK